MSRDSKRTTSTKKLVDKIDKITREKITKEKVVSLDDYRNLKNKERPKTILVVDDDATVRSALKRIFESDGFKVLTAADGTEFSKILDESHLELIVLDIGLPWINGFELAKLLKENDELKKVPIVFISGKTSEFDVKRGFQVGADDYIKKPFDVEEIKKTVRTLLSLR